MATNVQVYHGTPNDFEEFSFDFIGTQSGTDGAGFGIYFTESESEALCYGENIFKCLLKLKTNVSNDKVTFTRNFLKKVLTKLYTDFDINYFENYSIQFFPIETNDHLFDEIYQKLKRYSRSDTEIIGSFINAGVNPEKIFEILSSLGYDHTIDNDESYLNKEGIKHYIIYDLNSISILKKYNLENR
jgi:hypothetical protein